MPGTGTPQADFLDLLIDTLPVLPWEDIQVLLKHQVWVVCDDLMTNTFPEDEGGKHIEIQVEYQAADSGGYIDPGEVRTPAMENAITNGTIDFCYDYFDYSVTEHELMANRSRSRIQNHLQGKRRRAFLGWCERTETRFFGLPDTSNNKKPYGLPYWLPPITAAQAATEANNEGKHQGVHASGFSDAGGISATTYSRWKSYNANWPTSDAVINQEAKVRLARMFRHLHFRAPKIASNVNDKPFSNLKMMTNETVIEELGKAAQNQNDNLGADVTKHLHQILVNGIPVDWVPELDTADTTNRGAHPMYFVNLNEFKTHVDPAMQRKERKPMVDRDQPDVATVYVDNKFQWVTKNRQRCGGVISYVAA
jgi:hypothetical protein